MTKRAAYLLAVLLGTALACSSGQFVGTLPSPYLQTPVVAPTHTLAPSPAPPATVTPAPTPTVTPQPSPTPFGCGQRPIEDCARVPVREWVVNQRTLAMLAYAQSLYDGPNDLLLSITQGSYNAGVDASFGSHDGGGALDLSVYNQGPEAGRLDQGQIEALVRALRQAGFAAWQRDADDLYPGSPPHIHAIAVGDAELSEAAQGQLTGENGYFRGRNGLPDERGAPDRHGGPIVCPWMIEMGYADLTQQ